MEKGKITSLQMALLMYPTIVATAILAVPSLTAKYAQQDLWISPILASVVGLFTVYVTCRLNKLYPNKTIIQMSENIMGKVPGKLITLFFLFFYIHVTGLIVRDYSEFLVGSFFFKTPITIISGSMVFLCALAVRGGIEVLGRMAQLFSPVFCIPLIILILLLIPEFKISNLSPVLEGGFFPAMKGAIVPSGWFSEFFIMIFLLPFLNEKKKGMKYGMVAVVVVMLTLVVVNLTVQLVLGTTTATKVYPLMNVSRYIGVGDFFEHLESISMAIWIMGAFVKISVFYYAVSSGIAEWFNLSDFRLVIWPVAILIVEFSFWSIPNIMEYSRFDFIAFPFYAIFIQVIIPVFLLIIATIQKKRESKNK
ncbi:endospore germination permease [Heyndrickxia oleronia]|uniref:GerAB/ArcD/ProY family transporter n=1 Tax=Heyndrickxia oleronia TaxID=38875 RepID=UPI003F274B8D